MSTHHPIELELIESVNDCPDCRAARLTACQGDLTGALILHRDMPVGLWSMEQGVLAFQCLANAEAIRTAADVDTALAISLEMAVADRWHS